MPPMAQLEGLHTHFLHHRQPSTQRVGAGLGKYHTLSNRTTFFYKNKKIVGSEFTRLEETRKHVFSGETGSLPPHFGTIIFNRLEKGAGVRPPPPHIFGPSTETYRQHAAKCRKTPQNTAKHHKTPQNTAKCYKMPQNTAKCRKTPQNAAKRLKTPENSRASR